MSKIDADLREIVEAAGNKALKRLEDDGIELDYLIAENLKTDFNKTLATLSKFTVQKKETTVRQEMAIEQLSDSQLDAIIAAGEKEIAGREASAKTKH
jgi:hypothetical protein